MEGQVDEKQLKIERGLHSSPIGDILPNETSTQVIQENNGNSGVMKRKEKLITSGLIFFCTFTMGLSLSILNPSFLELSIKLRTPISTTSNAFTVLTITVLVGTLSCGFLFNYVNRQLTTVLLLVAMGASVISFPIAPTVTLLFFTVGLLGFSVGGYDCAHNVWMVEIWESHAAPYIQIQHFCYALGSFISPVLVKPFLVTTELDNNEDEAPPPNFENNTHSLSVIVISEHEEYESTDYHNPSLWVPYFVGGLVIFVGAILILISYCVKKYEKPRTSEQLSSSVDELETKESLRRGSSRRNIIIIIMSALMIGTYQGMEMCSMEFLPAFAHFIDLHLPEPDGALLLSGLTGAFTIGRGLGIFIVFKLPPEVLLVSNFVLILAGSSCLHLLASNSMGWLWTGSILVGLGFSTLFPAFYGYVEKHLRITNVIGAIMLSAGDLINACYPFIIGHYIEKNPMVLVYTIYFSLAICNGAFAVIYALTRN